MNPLEKNTAEFPPQEGIEKEQTAFLGDLSIDSDWTESTGRPLQEGEEQFFHSTYAYRITPEQYRQLRMDEEFVLDRRMFVDRIPQIGYGQIPNPESRPYRENPDELVLLRFITKDPEPFTKIQKEALDLDALNEGGFVGGPETRFDPRFLHYNLKLKKLGEERLENYSFPHRVITYEVEEKLPIEDLKLESKEIPAGVSTLQIKGETQEMIDLKQEIRRLRSTPKSLEEDGYPVEELAEKAPKPIPKRGRIWNRLRDFLNR